jgi:hypothetical protein
MFLPSNNRAISSAYPNLSEISYYLWRFGVIFVFFKSEKMGFNSKFLPVIDSGVWG